jgi:uncharacterized protein YyaL (SSP411 family)
MNRLIIVMTMGFLALGAGASAAVDWGHDYDAALAKAKTDHKLVLVDLYTDWCGWCKRLDRDTYSDKDVEAKVTKDFIAVKVNPETSQRNAALLTPA